MRAYSCRPAGAEWHVVVFAENARRARLLAYRHDPGVSVFVEWRARRLHRADGMVASEAVWIGENDAPAWVAASELWEAT